MGDNLPSNYGSCNAGEALEARAGIANTPPDGLHEVWD